MDKIEEVKSEQNSSIHCFLFIFLSLTISGIQRWCSMDIIQKCKRAFLFIARRKVKHESNYCQIYCHKECVTVTILEWVTKWVIKSSSQHQATFFHYLSCVPNPDFRTRSCWMFVALGHAALDSLLDSSYNILNIRSCDHEASIINHHIRPVLHYNLFFQPFRILIPPPWPQVCCWCSV